MLNRYVLSPTESQMRTLRQLSFPEIWDAAARIAGFPDYKTFRRNNGRDSCMIIRWEASELEVFSENLNPILELIP